MKSWLSQLEKMGTPGNEVAVAVAGQDGERDDREFRKANSAISTRVVEGGTLTLLGRRLFNTLLYHTQKIGEPGENVPAGQDHHGASYYWLPLQAVVSDVDFGSKDWRMLTATLKQLQGMLLLSDEPTGGFTSRHLLGNVRVVPGKGRRPTMLGWKFDEESKDLLRDPQFYTKLSFFHLSSLHTPGGTALYELSKRYVTSPGGVTRREHWTWWYDFLTGSPANTERQEYRYFKRDVLKRALEEVNATDISVELLEFKHGRAIAELQFKVTPAAQQSLELPPAPLIDNALLDRIEALGISKREAEDLQALHADSFLRATVALVEERIRNTTLAPILSTAAFLRKALKDRYADASKPKARHKALPTPEAPEPAPDPEHQARIAQALAIYDAGDEAAKERTNQAFKSTGPSYARLKPGSVAFRKILANWLLENPGQMVA